jgi:hypothetical protein
LPQPIRSRRDAGTLDGAVVRHDLQHQIWCRAEGLVEEIGDLSRFRCRIDETTDAELF